MAKMTKTEVHEWIQRADLDLSEAEFLLENNRPFENVAYFLHQALEKYLKAYLLYNRWELEKIHDLVKLTETAKKYDKEFEPFVQLMRDMASYYIESRYPVGYVVTYSRSEITKSLKTAKRLKTLVLAKITAQKTKKTI